LLGALLPHIQGFTPKIPVNVCYIEKGEGTGTVVGTTEITADAPPLLKNGKMAEKSGWDLAALVGRCLTKY
jgi:hypothetical protein